MGCVEIGEREDGTVGSFKTAECSQQSRYIIHVLAGSAALTRRVVSSRQPLTFPAVVKTTRKSTT